MKRSPPGEVALSIRLTFAGNFASPRERRDLALSLYDELEEPISDVEQRHLANRRRPADVEGNAARQRRLKHRCVKCQNSHHNRAVVEVSS